jgi:hypothetical protein
LLGEILVSGLGDATIAPLIATVIEIDAMQAEKLPILWREADETLVEIISRVELAWQALRDEWSATRELTKRINAEMSATAAERGLSRNERADRLLEVDRALGGPAARARLSERLRELISAYANLPMIATCRDCGHYILEAPV